MKKGFILIAAVSVLICSSAVFAQSPNWNWAKRIGGTSTAHDSGGSITTDAAGNTYTAGFFGGTVDFNPGAGVCNLTAVNSNDNFILKLDPAGNFLWARTLSTFNFDNIHSIVVDASGNVYTIGYFNGTVDFDPGAGVFNLTSAGVYDVYIWKLNSSGNFIWAKAFGGTGMDEGCSIALDASANVYAAGSFRGTADFDPGVGIFNLTSVGTEDNFIFKLDIAGNFIWAKTFGGIDNAICFGIDINPSPGADIFMTGAFSGTSDFDPGAGLYNLTSTGNNDIYISKMDSAGNFIWAKAIGSSTNNDYGFSIAADPSGNGDVYTKGSFQGTVDFDPGVGVFNLTGTGGYLCKLNSSGNFIWAIALGGGAGQGRSIDFDAAGNVYASGYFTGTADFDPGPGTFNLTSAGAGDICIYKFNSAGNFMWVKTAGGISHDVSISIAVYASSHVYVTGLFHSNSMTFNPIAITNASSSSTYGDAFIARLDLPSTPLPINLLDFDARLNKKTTVDLHWVTSSETNNDYFTVEKSNDGSQFEFVFNVDGAGNSSALKEYSGVDDNPFPGVNYYRLKQTDFDGHFTYSEIKSVNVENEFVSDIVVYPNPASCFVNIRFRLSQPAEVSLELLDVTGRYVTTIAQDVYEGESNQETWDASSITEGIYFLKMNAGSFTAIKRITVAR